MGIAITRRSRLFWRFFLAFWLAQMLAALAVGVTMGLLRHDGRRLDLIGPAGPPPGPGGRPDGDPGDWRGDWRGGPAPPMNGPPGAMQLPLHRPPSSPPRGDAIPMVPLVPVLIGGVVSLMFAGWLAHQFSRPIRRLKQGFEELSSGNLAARVDVDDGWVRDDLDALGRDFNRMAERLQILVLAHKRLLHDVSHEVRSPLARLQAAADLVVQQPDRLAEFAERIVRETSRMDALVGEILRLARLESDTVNGARPRVMLDLKDMVEDVVQALGISADAVPCTLQNHVALACTVEGDQDYLLRALENVIDNAIRHSPPQGVVRLSSQALPDGMWQITCDDDGSGVFEEDLDRIFEPFYRAQSAREGTGHGLGLAIARKVFETHGGGISAVNRPGHGLSVRMTLPAVTAPD